MKNNLLNRGVVTTFLSPTVGIMGHFQQPGKGARRIEPTPKFAPSKAQQVREARQKRSLFGAGGAQTGVTR